MASAKNGKRETQSVDTIDVGKVPPQVFGDEIDTSTRESEQIGFAPYWKPEEKKSIICRVSARDERDPEFKRYLVQVEQTTPCKGGPVENAEDVIVKKGEHCSLSVYYALAEPFDFLLEQF